jgi:hypothetical protein
VCAARAEAALKQLTAVTVLKSEVWLCQLRRHKSAWQPKFPKQQDAQHTHNSIMAYMSMILVNLWERCHRKPMAAWHAFKTQNKLTNRKHLQTEVEVSCANYIVQSRGRVHSLHLCWMLQRLLKEALARVCREFSRWAGVHGSCRATQRGAADRHTGLWRPW